ncbi:MAG: N-acetyltransferase [Sulfobacillus acidophilus]|uniref:N-acetyltransferase n=1 Tax=Sulfobacillus acidophilus TaxID=53633 RepID=A0A2T2WEU2_9FIRM|nr:MAG: N-acetyltransferase [Sulfobacillus acidophilus]
MTESRGPVLPITYYDRTGQPYQVRDARPEDGAVLVELLNRVGGEEIYIADEGAQLTAEQESALISQKNPDLQCILVAERQGQVAGSLEMIRGALQKNRHTAMFGMALFAAFRGHGIGRGLLQSAEAWALSVGVEKVSLTVFATNRQAIRLYQSLGYREEGRRRDQYRIRGALVDEVWMAHWLTQAHR